MLQWVVQNGPLVAWAFAALVTGFTVLTGMEAGSSHVLTKFGFFVFSQLRLFPLR